MHFDHRLFASAYLLFVQGWVGCRYYEVSVLAVGEAKFVGVGLVPAAGYPAHRQPGWEGGSWGYHSDDGKLYEGQAEESKAKRKAPSFGAGDVVGCGIVFQRHGCRMFWTLNGKLLTDLSLPCTNSPKVAVGGLTAAVGLASVGDAVAMNFGTDQTGWPFLFDLAEIEAQPESIGQLCRLAGVCATANPAESARSYSSIHNSDPPGGGHGRSAIGSAQAWSAGANTAGQWLQIDLGKDEAVSGVVVQRRKDIPEQYIKTYKIQHSTDGAEWSELPGVQTCHWTGRQPAEEKSVNKLDLLQPLKARYIRLDSHCRHCQTAGTHSEVTSAVSKVVRETIMERQVHFQPSD